MSCLHTSPTISTRKVIHTTLQDIQKSDSTCHPVACALPSQADVTYCHTFSIIAACVSHEGQCLFQGIHSSAAGRAYYRELERTVFSVPVRTCCSRSCARFRYRPVNAVVHLVLEGLGRSKTWLCLVFSSLVYRQDLTSYSGFVIVVTIT